MLRVFIILFTSLTLLASCETTVNNQVQIEASQANDDQRPNIVLVLFEDLGLRFGAYGDPIAHTPNFDQLAEQSVRYTRAFTTSGVCAPSRAALITGRYQQTITAQHMRTTSAPGFPPGGPQNYLAVPPSEVKAFPELLRKAGYYTSNDSKTDYQFGEPFTIWDASGTGADWSGREQTQPFFHMQTLLTTHESAIWPTNMTVTNPVEGFVVARNAEIFADRVARTEPGQVEVPPYLPDTPKVRRDIATHYDNIAFTDAALGALIERLEAEGLLENSIVIVSTDHGDGLPRMKRSLYDSGLHVPLLVRYPDGFGAGTVNDELISFVDLAPTILSWAGIDRPDWMQGFDLAGDDRDKPRDYIYAAQDRMDNEKNWRRAVRDVRFKYIQNRLPGDPYFEPLPFRDSQPSMKSLWLGREAGTLPDAAQRLFEPLPTEQLYDTTSDPHEIRNLADDPEYSSQRARLKQALESWLLDVGDMSNRTEAEMIAQIWPGGEQPQTLAVEFDSIFEKEKFIVTLASTTFGASIGYQIDENTEAWQIYNEPIRLKHGSQIRAKAVRYGYSESKITEMVLD